MILNLNAVIMRRMTLLQTSTPLLVVLLVSIGLVLADQDEENGNGKYEFMTREEILEALKEAQLRLEEYERNKEQESDDTGDEWWLEPGFNDDFFPDPDQMNTDSLEDAGSKIAEGIDTSSLGEGVNLEELGGELAGVATNETEEALEEGIEQAQGKSTAAATATRTKLQQ